MFIKYIDDIICRQIEKKTYTKKQAETITSGYEHLYYWISNPKTMQNNEMLFICCEIMDIKLLYGKYGGKKVISIIKNLVSNLSEKLNGDEVCSCFSENRFCVITTSQQRVDEIFRELKNSIIFINEPISITLGTHIFQPNLIKEIDDVYDLFGEAFNHTVYIYKNHNSGSHLLYEKLYNLRKELENFPEKMWRIDVMCDILHISRSTLQKNYKAFFGKSIIDELIIFRIKKTKKLLANTNYP